MKKIFIMAAAMLFLSSGSAFSEGMVFDPTEYTVDTTTTQISEKPVAKESTLPSHERIKANTQESSNYAQNSVSGQAESFNNALYELDTAQVNIRNELLEYQAKYQEVDTQYKLIKEQRRVLDEQIKSVERRIRAIENSKKQIRKTMI